jgi:hypothetical protein
MLDDLQKQVENLAMITKGFSGLLHGISLSLKEEICSNELSDDDCIDEDDLTEEEEETLAESIKETNDKNESFTEFLKDNYAKNIGVIPYNYKNGLYIAPKEDMPEEVRALLDNAGFYDSENEMIGSETAFDRITDTDFIHGYTFECITDQEVDTE